MSATGQSVAVRETPGTVSNRYHAGKNYEINFQVLVRDSNFVTASNLTHEITQALDGLGQGAIRSQDGSFKFIKSEVYTLPNWVERTNEGDIFTAMFVAELEIL